MIDSSAYDMVVLDAANIAHHNVLVDGDEASAIDPGRLEAMVDLCEELGWMVKAFMKHGTYFWATQNTDSDLVGDVKPFDRLIRSKRLELLEVKKDDIFWIDYALNNNALIISKDLFKPERKDYPDRDWESIDKCTIRDYTFTDQGEIMMPALPQKGEDGGRRTYRTLSARLNELEDRVERLTMVLKEADIVTTPEDVVFRGEEAMEEVDSVQAITHAVYDRYLRSGDQVHMTRIYHALVQAHLGLGARHQDWPEGWQEKMCSILGVEGRPASWLEDLSPRLVERAGDNRDHFRYVD